MYQKQTFMIPELKGISNHTITNHLKLYEGYVKFSNSIDENIQEYRKDAEDNALAINELQRRFSFEFNGMRNHAYYFKSLEGGAKIIQEESELKKDIDKQFGDFDTWLKSFVEIATTRGTGWVMMYYDLETEKFIHAWVDEHHLGQLAGLPLILCLDMWEHAFIMDYAVADKKKYVIAFFENLNWSVIEKNYLTALCWRG
jgi:Fe-Mn family superoxide dismutase